MNAKKIEQSETRKCSYVLIKRFDKIIAVDVLTPGYLIFSLVIIPDE